MMDEEYIPIIERMENIEMYLAIPPAKTHVNVAYATIDSQKINIKYSNGSLDRVDIGNILLVITAANLRFSTIVEKSASANE